MTTRIAVIGAGIMGADHARIVAEDLPGASLQVVCDMDANRARSVADALGARDAGSDPFAVIDRADVDAVIIASPDVTHAPLSIACIKAGKPVLCEKPLSQSSAECQQVMEAEQAAGRQFVQVGFMRRFEQSYVEMKQALDSGRLGRALMMHNFHRNLSTPASEFTGAMAITNSAPHEFDVVRHVLGTEYVAISAYQPKRSDGLVAPVLMVLETADNQIVTIEINNNAAYGYDVRAELVGEQASVSMNQVAYTRFDGDLTNRTAYDTDWRCRYAEAYWRQNKAFLHFARTGVFPPQASSTWDGFCAALIAETGVRALASASRITMGRMDKPAFYA